MYYLLGSAAMQAKEVAATGGKAGLSIIESSILGALLILSVVLNIWLVKTVISVQNLRIEDKDKDSKRIEGLNSKLVEIFSGVKNSLDNLTAAETTGQSILQSVKQSLDTVILAAVRGGGSMGAGPARPPGGE